MRLLSYKKRLQLALGLGCWVFGVVSVAEPSFAQDAADTSTDTSAQNEEQIATAKLHFKNGVELLQSEPPNYQDAYRQFELAREMLLAGGSDRSWKVLGNLGLCALKLERDGEALAYYGEYLKTGGDQIDPRERAAIERELLLLRGNMTTVTVESSDPSARISVRRQGSSAPTQLYDLDNGKAELGLRAGSLTVTARGEKGTLTWESVLSAGETASHKFDFDAKDDTQVDAAPATAPAAATSETPSAQKSGPSTLQIAGYATAGVGVVALGVGGVLGISSQNKEKSAEEKCIDGVCKEATEGDFDSAKQMASTANILFIAGGVLAATGVTLVIVGGKSPTEKPPTSAARLQLSPLAALGGGGLFASGHF